MFPPRPVPPGGESEFIEDHGALDTPAVGRPLDRRRADDHQPGDEPMIMEHRRCRQGSTGDIEVEVKVGITPDEARAITWYVGGPVETALQRIIRDRITRAVDAYERADKSQGGPQPRAG